MERGLPLHIIESENLKALRERDESLTALVERKEKIEFKIKETQNLAKQAVRWINLGQQGVVLLLGLGYGYFAKEIIKRFTPGHRLIIYEPDVGRFRYALSKYNLVDVIRHPQVAIILGEVIEYSPLVYMYHESMVNGHLWVVKNKYALEDSTKGDMFDTFFARFIEEKKFWDTNIGTQLNIGKHFSNSILHNVPNIMKAKSILSLKDCCKDKPALIISAGPSLDNCLDAIRKAKGKMVLIVVDASAQYLLDNGIVPDLICGIDPLDENIALFQTDEIRQLPLVVMSQYTPQVLENHTGDIYVSGQMGNPAYSWLQWFWEDKGNPDSFGGSVSHYATTVAEILGCNTIGLIGQDLSFKTKIHAGDVTKILCDYSGAEVPDETLSATPTTNTLGEPCYTKQNFLSFKTAFENKIRHTQQLKWYNFTKGGLNIEGAENHDLETYLEELPNIEFKIHYDYVPDYDAAGCAKRLEEGIKILKRVRKASLVILKYVHKMKDLRNQRTRGANAKIKPLAKKVEEWLRPKTQHPFIAFLGSYHIQLELYLRRYDISAIDKMKDKWKRFDHRIDRALNYYGELVEGCELLCQNIEIALKKVKEMSDATTHQPELESGTGEEAYVAQGMR